MTLTVAATAGSAPVDDLIGEVAAELPKWQATALQLAVVQDGNILFAGGLGVRSVDDLTPVTSQTLFHHGSCGKAYTALLATVLADVGMLDLDAPVRQYVPELQLPDPVISDRVTTRDLLSHRSGIARHDFAWILNPSWTRIDLLPRLAHLPPHGDLRAEMHYSNLGYALAGRVIERVTGGPWEEALAERVLEPAGMTRTTTSLAVMRGDPDHAIPHTVRDGELVPTIYRPADMIAPAGELMTCADDAARWLLLHCAAGDVDGERPLPPAAITATHRLQIPMPPELTVHESIEVIGYSLGWVVTRFRGHAMLLHAGGVDGFRTDVLVLPGARIGVAASANQLSSRLPFAAVLQIADRLLDPTSGTSFYDDLRVDVAAPDAPPQGEAHTEEAAPPSHPVNAYVGRYVNAGYGDLAVSAPGGALEVRLGECDLDTTHRHFDTWDITYSPLNAELAVTFVTDADGTVSEAVVRFEQELDATRFDRSDPGSRA